MTVDFQATLFDALDDGRSDSARLGSLGPSVRRTPLSAGAWVDVRPGWVTGADDLFLHLLREVPWYAERRRMYDRVVDVPRLLKFYGEGEVLPDPVLAEARDQLSAHYVDELGEPFTTAGLCYYRDGRDSVAWHGDTIGRSRTEDTMVAIVSFGEARGCCSDPGRARMEAARSRSRSATGTWSSWAARASAPGSTPSPRPPIRSARGSACSSAPAASADAQDQDRARAHPRPWPPDGG